MTLMDLVVQLTPHATIQPRAGRSLCCLGVCKRLVILNVSLIQRSTKTRYYTGGCLEMQRVFFSRPRIDGRPSSQPAAAHQQAAAPQQCYNQFPEPRQHKSSKRE